MAPNDNAAQGSVVPLGDNSASQEIVAGARSRSDGFEMGGDRAIVDKPNWDNYDSDTLYKSATNNNDPGTAQATSHAWTHHGNELRQASDHLYNAIADLGAAWVGQGAGAAQGALVAIANSGQQASDAAHTMSDRLARQADAAAKVKQMPPAVQYDPKLNMGAALAAGPAAMTDDQKAAHDHANSVKAQQVAMLNEYTQQMSAIDQSTPSFGPESLGMKPTDTHNSNAAGSFGSVGGVGALQSLPGGFSGDLAGYHGAGVAGHGTQGAAAAAAAAAGSHGQVGHDAGQVVAGLGSGAGTAAGHTASGAAASSGRGLRTGLGLGLGALGGGLGALGARALSGGNKSGSKQQSEDTEASAHNQTAQSAASTSAPQQGMVSAGGTIGGETPPPPMGQMGGMGAGAHGAHAEEEAEHTHASFLIEADPDEAFGANQATPPPVIGAWSEDEDEH